METVLRIRRPWNKGILVGQKRPLQPKNVWSIRVRLEMSGAIENWPSSISPSTASSAPVI
jgi:hypothetical protein